MLARMGTELTLTHERVDDIPLLIGLAQTLHLPELVDQHIGNHGLHQGLSNGWLTAVWLAYILSEGDHRKSSVEEWVQRHRCTLEQMVGRPVRRVDFSDDRLGNLLRRFSHTPAWEDLEAGVWHSSALVYELEVDQVRLDSTTTYGYHTSTEGGLMQHGHSKDHRPDLPQLKLMAALAEPAEQWIASDVHPGNAADDPLYTPLIDRVHHTLGRRGLLYIGDCKMAALSTRAGIAAHEDYYLMPLPLNLEAEEQIEAWFAALETCNQVTLVWEDGKLVGGGHELERTLNAEVDGQTVTWTERVQWVYSPTLARQQERHLEQRLRRAEAGLLALTPPVGRGRRQIREQATLENAVNAILERHQVTDLLQVAWVRHEETQARYEGRGRGGPDRKTHTEVKVRYEVTAVERQAAALTAHQRRLGWRILVTNLPVEQTSLPQTVLIYRQGWHLEHDFHRVKDRPIGIRPIYVRRDDQILGLIRLLTLALRLLTLIETQVRHGLARDGSALRGLYEGQPNRTTDRPTAVRLLKAVARAEITLTKIQMDGHTGWHLTPVPAWLPQVLGYLKLSPTLYTRLTENSP